MVEFPKNFDKLLDMPAGTVVDAIPPEERTNYYLRGASLGTLAINLASEVNRINPRNDLRMHVAADPTPDAYDYAECHASIIARHGTSVHFNEEERRWLSDYTGQEVAEAPAIVFGVPRDDFLVTSDPETHNPVIMAEIPLGAIDPYSQAKLSEIFDVDVAELPPTPGAQGPDFAPLKPVRFGG